MRTKLAIATIACLTMIAFQNCGKAGDPAVNQPHANNSAEQVVGSAANYNKITYDQALEMSQTPSNGHVSIDLSTGALEIVLSSGTYNCTADAARLQQARDIIAGSNICVPSPLGSGQVQCLAIALADIELSNGNSDVQLRANACNNGTFLCDGNDAKLRDLLADLKANLPAGCH